MPKGVYPRTALHREISLRGLQRASEVNVTHGLGTHPQYQRWYHMMERCYRVGDQDYPGYGGRGISVFEGWHDIRAFVEYLDSELGPCPEGYSLDRIDNDGNYEPGNIRWASGSQQQRNTRKSNGLREAVQSGRRGGGR